MSHLILLFQFRNIIKIIRYNTIASVIYYINTIECEYFI
jgi:hypothetical protein